MGHFKLLSLMAVGEMDHLEKETHSQTLPIYHYTKNFTWIWPGSPWRFSIKLYSSLIQRAGIWFPSSTTAFIKNTLRSKLSAGSASKTLTDKFIQVLISFSLHPLFLSFLLLHNITLSVHDKKKSGERTVCWGNILTADKFETGPKFIML